jgi:Ca2+-binding RTX toxin-like protein
MAKKSTFELFPAFYDGVTLTNLVMVSATNSKVVCIDPTLLFTVTLGGKNLKVNDGMMTSGTIQSLRVTTEDGDPVVAITGLSMNVGIVTADTMSEFATMVIQLAVIGNNKVIGTNESDDLSLYASLGNDMVFGKGGDDMLDGSVGKDVLVGGGGEDQFVFSANMSTDKIRDFDADNGDGAQDLIDAAFASATIEASANGKDTIVDFGEGDRFILLGVKSNEINASDFTS